MSRGLLNGRACATVSLTMIQFPGAEPARSVEPCPECTATAAVIAARSAHFVSLRCTECGEVWLVRERRKWAHTPDAAPALVALPSLP